jgi:hypothetical protein
VRLIVKNADLSRADWVTAPLSHPFLVFAAIVAVSISWRVIRMFWAPERRQLGGQDIAVLLRAAALRRRDPAAAEAMVRAHFEPRVREEEAARAVLWSKVDIDREAAQDLRRRVLNDIRVQETHSTQLGQQEPQNAGELVKAQAALAKARAELERLDTILARPRDD